VIPLQRFLDPLLLLGIILLGIYKYIGIWMSDNSLDSYLQNFAINLRWLVGLTGVIGLLVGIIRPVVVAMLQRQYIASVVFYLTFWLVLCLPSLCLNLGVGFTEPSGKLYWSMLLLMFMLVNVLVILSVVIAKSIPKRNKLY
jgi:hypothetical protein